MDRKPLPATLLIAAFAAWLAAGCGTSDPGEFRSYSELEQSDRRAGADTDAAGRSGDGAVEQPRLPDMSSAGEAPAAVDTRPHGGVPVAEPRVEPHLQDRIEAPRPVRAAGPGPTAVALDRSTPAGTDQVSSHDAVRPAISPDLARVAVSDPPVEAPRPEPREIKLLVPHRSFRTEGPEGAIRVSYDDIDLLKVLNMEPVPPDCVAYFPEWLRELDGKRIRIRGFMYPPFETTGIRGFVLARDNQICCFGRDPKRYDVIDVFLRQGVTTDYIQNRPFDVVGVFHVQPEADDGELYQLYVIDDAVVID